MQKTKFKKLEKPKGGPMAKSEKTTGGTLGKSKNVRYFFVKNISFNPKKCVPAPSSGLISSKQPVGNDLGKLGADPSVVLQLKPIEFQFEDHAWICSKLSQIAFRRLFSDNKGTGGCGNKI